MRLLLLVALFGLAGLATFADQQQEQPTPFHKDNSYTFQYNVQVCSGLIASSDEDAGEPQQKASIRIQAQAKITFTSDRHAQLRLQQIRIGQLNEHLEAPEKVQPMAIFEPKQMPSEKQRQLELPCQFNYADGVVERVQFHADDDTWSQNLKRAVLNMIQLNLRKNNVQGLRAGDEQPVEQEDDQDENLALSKMSRSFSIPEITMEGACQTTYTINRAGQQQQQQKTSAFNVTKTINFKQCSKIADVAYGFQTEQPQTHCAQCQLYWFKRQQKNGQQYEQQQPGEQHPCERCDPKEVKEHMLDRSTVLRYQLACPSSNCEEDQKYALKRTELLSQYVFKQAKAQSGKYSSAMHTVVAATLQFRSVGPKESETVPNMSGSKDESLLYSNQVDTEVKRFYMFGDEEYPEASSSPFHQVPKVSQAEQALRKLAQIITGDKQKGIELQAGFEQQRLVELLRMCTGQELKSIQQNVQNGQISTQMNQQEKQKAKHFFTDALAICGTHNCVQQLAENIQSKQITQTKAVQALKTMTQVPAPSDQIVKIVERLCKQEGVHGQQKVKQACWLTFGALVNELCQHKTQKGAQQGPFGAQTGFDKLEICPLDKKQQYKEAILELYKSAASTYDKVLALSALGNAGLDIAVGDIEQIVKDQYEARLVRSMAIDSLRRLRTQMPRKIQQILLPIFQNVHEQPEVRSAAVAVLMGTKPEASVIDQIAYTISKEPNRQVQAFVYRQMKAMAYSKSPMDQEIAKHIKNTLKMANVDEQELRNSGKWQIPVFNEQLQEGLFIKLAQIVSPRSAMPAYLHAQVDSLFNDQFWAGTMKVFMAQQEAEDWIQDVMSTRQNGGKTRAERRTTDNEYGQSLRDIYSTLGIRSRRYWPLSSINGNNDEQSVQYAQNNRQPFAMLTVRIGDVDQGFVAIESNLDGRDNKFMEAIRQVLSGQTQSGRLFEQSQQGQQRQQMWGAISTNLNEKRAIIPTSIGLPLRVLTSTPVLATIEGHTQVNTESASLESPLGAQAQINVHAMASVMHIQKIENTLPFLASGVESIRSVELNAPVQAELNANQAQGVSLKVKLPRQRVTILGFHSLPFTFTAQVDARTQLQQEPRHVRAIHQPKLERMQYEVSRNYKAAEQLGIPLHIQGHYHWPSQPTRYEQYIQMLMASENMMHLTYQPNEETPREAVFRISGSKFQKTSGQMPQMQDFYSNRIESAFDQQELDEMQTDNVVQRRQKLQTFLGRYQPDQQYKHSLKVSAQTVGGPKECRAQAEVATVCDASMQSCNLQVEAQRSPIGGEGQKWTLKAQAQLILPETVRSTEQLTQLEQQKNNKFQCKANVEWGAEQKQQIAIRLQGEHARKHGQQSSRQQRQAFLNKYDLEADYQLKPETQNFFVRALELIKSKYYWNTQSQLIGQGRQGNGGKVLASLVIDPITQKHANASIKTPGQVVRLQQFQLPIQSRPFPLVRRQQQSIHSVGQFFQRIQADRRAECTVDGQSVNTFDNADYSAPLFSKCYSVLAKDCSSEEPQFVVLMKALGASNGQKKLKVIGQEIGQIECQPKSSSSGPQQQILCKHNGKVVQEDNDSDAVDFNNAQKSDVTIHLQGISVRFNGRKAWLKVSPMYKNGQCGLCGNYDDNSEDEWRMSNNQNTDNLVEFHRSYALKGNYDGEQCTDRELDKFYLQHGNGIRKVYREQQQYNDEENNSQEEDQQELGQFDGHFDEDSDEWNDQEQEDNNNNQQQRQSKRRQTQEPVKKTKVLEMNHQICFSQVPVKQCPTGTVAIYKNNQSQEDEWENDNNKDDDRKNVRFTCLSRSSPEARRLLRQIRNGNSDDIGEQLEKRANSVAEKIREPKKCMRNRF